MGVALTLVRCRISVSDVGYRYRTSGIISDCSRKREEPYPTALGRKNLEEHVIAVILSQTAPHIGEACSWSIPNLSQQNLLQYQDKRQKLQKNSISIYHKLKGLFIKNLSMCRLPNIANNLLTVTVHTKTHAVSIAGLHLGLCSRGAK